MMKGSYLVLCALVLLTAAPSLAHRGLRQAPQQQGPQQPPQLPAQLQAVGNTAKSFFQSAIQDVFSALEYSAGDQQKIASTPKPQPVYCGTTMQAVHLQVTGSSCNVTVFDINALYTTVTNPTTPCDHSVYNKSCTVFAGSLLIDISPAFDVNSGNFIKQQNPDVQGWLAKLGLGGLVSAGMLSVNVLVGSAIQVQQLSFLPYLEVIAGIPTGASTDFQQPFISQLKINGGGPIPGIGVQTAVPSFSSLAMKPKKVVGNLQVVGTALPDQGGLDQLLVVTGNAMVADNPALASFNAYLLQTIGSGLTLFQNPALTTFAAPDLTSIASNAPADVITTGLQISQNPSLVRLNLPMLEAIGGPMIIYNNSALASLESLEHLAVVNATGRSAPSIPIPALKGPPGTGATVLPGLSITPPSVLIFGNPQLYDVAALAKLGKCSSNPTATSDPIFIEVYPKGANLKCTFTAWAPLCQYILDQMTVSQNSALRTNGVCISTQ